MPFFSRPSTRSIAARALLLGISAGMRSITPLGTLAALQQDAPRHASWKDWPVLRSRFGRTVLELMWVGELIADKLPTIPPRINRGPLTVRILMGTLAGVAIGTEGKGTMPKVAGGFAGVAGAIAGAYGGYTARTWLAEKTDVPDLPVALAADVAAMAIARKGVCG